METLVMFLIFCLVQSMAIVGLRNCFSDNEIFSGVARFVKWVLGEYWSRPFVSCVKCMASVWGSATFWPPVIHFYGFNWFEIYVWIIDMFVLVFLNYFLYKRA